MLKSQQEIQSIHPEHLQLCSGCHLPSLLPDHFCFLHWVTAPISQLAAMAGLQVITETGIRLHKNLHVCNCCYLPQPNSRRGIIFGSLECDTPGWGPFGSPVVSQVEGKHTQGPPHTNTPPFHFSLRKHRLYTRAG